MVAYMQVALLEDVTTRLLWLVWNQTVFRCQELLEGLFPENKVVLNILYHFYVLEEYLHTLSMVFDGQMCVLTSNSPIIGVLCRFS